MKFPAIPIIFSLFSIVAIIDAMPLSPESVARLRRSGRLEQVAAREADARARGVNAPGENIFARLRSNPNRDDGAEITLRVPVLLVDFSDNPANQDDYPAPHFESMLFSVGDLNPGSMRDWFRENSYDEIDVIGEVIGWLRMPQTYAYYVNGRNGLGDYPRNSQGMTRDAVQIASDRIDFSDYDNDDDGFVDALYIVHAGPGAEANDGDEDMIWSHAWALNNNRIRLDGVWINRYNTVPEDGQIGVFGHELGHSLFGLPDLYDRDYSSSGIGLWSMMAAGSWGGGDGTQPTHFDAWSKMQIGIIDPVVLDHNGYDVSIQPIQSEDDAYILWTDGEPDREYFLIENRRRAGFDASLPAGGLLIYHIDEAVEDQNDHEWYPGHQNDGHFLVAVEQADGNFDMERDQNAGDDGDPFPGSSNNRAFDADSEPASDDYVGRSTNVSVNDIRLDNGVINCNLLVAPPAPDELGVRLRRGWNLISINVDPPEEFYAREEGPDIVRMTMQLRADEQRHHVILMKDEAGRFYNPQFGFNNIPHWNLGEGYWIKVDEDIETVWSGRRIAANADVPIAEGWNIIAYFPNYQLEADAPDFHVLAPIIDHVNMAKDGDGRFMRPAFNFSNMLPWRPGQGYQIHVSGAVTLNYPEE